MGSQKKKSHSLSRTNDKHSTNALKANGFQVTPEYTAGGVKDCSRETIRITVNPKKTPKQKVTKGECVEGSRKSNYRIIKDPSEREKEISPLL